MPSVVEKQVAERDKEVTQRLRTETEVARRQAEQQWEAERQVFGLRIANLENLSKNQQKELAGLKQEADRANKRAQDLAVSIIKSGRTDVQAGREASAGAPQ